ncbi:hypothetical protein BU25DRAFT_128465 [Macroventuria anomochaeta]|uniref:Uncharacterized protein n=1 Tax=Macroventuria anomochaeta TaxID=301207 RepID=A0ACB6RT79_9PLEO|nr:uncharacterized protein BU25DRAFT_128465 [Macroventuria anomochaeta]KAF2624902.1 hypothetical protein BU25DRAFT_128465 [Macroventuria anomochaeta]
MEQSWRTSAFLGVVERHHAVEVKMGSPAWGNVEQHRVCSSVHLQRFVVAACSCTCCCPTLAPILQGKCLRRFCVAGSAHACPKPVLCYSSNRRVARFSVQISLADGTRFDGSASPISLLRSCGCCIRTPYFGRGKPASYPAKEAHSLPDHPNFSANTTRLVISRQDASRLDRRYSAGSSFQAGGRRRWR